MQFAMLTLIMICNTIFIDNYIKVKSKMINFMKKFENVNLSILRHDKNN